MQSAKLVLLAAWLLGSAPLASSHVFDCDAGKANWKYGWSEWKKEWCCRHGGPEGCEGHQIAFTFVGFGDANEARRACGGHGMVAMPRSQDELQAFDEVIKRAVAAGNITSHWPKNTVWLGGMWDNNSSAWLRDDGTPIGAGISAQMRHLSRSSHHKQQREPFLCSEVRSGPWPGGRWQDSAASFQFGIVCQEVKVSTPTSTSATRTSAAATIPTSSAPLQIFVTTTATTTTSNMFDCKEFLLHWKDAWTDEKKDWCCSNKGVGCIFICAEGLENWKEDWSLEKKAWCCQSQDLGCPENPFEAAEQERWYQQAADIARALQTSAPTTAAPSTTTSAAPELEFDCSAGFGTWRVSWTRSKKASCCKTEGRGCEEFSDVVLRDCEEEGCPEVASSDTLEAFSSQSAPPRPAPAALSAAIATAVGATATVAVAAIVLRRLKGGLQRSRAINGSADETIEGALLIAPPA